MIDSNKYKNKHITLSRDDRTDTTMSYYELSRWFSLIEGVEYISKKCEQLNIPDRSNCWVKPNALQKYVDERCTSILFEITNEDTIE
jgi:hypothetical protein